MPMKFKNAIRALLEEETLFKEQLEIRQILPRKQLAVLQFQPPLD